MRSLPIIVAVACAVASLPAAAQTLKPGLWEMQNKTEGNAELNQSIAQMQKELAAMPPEQRKQAEAIMAKHGMQMGPAGGGAMRTRVCMTREMIERNEIPATNGDCRTSQQRRSGNTLNMAFTCTNPTSTGDVRVTFVSPEAFTSTAHVTSIGDGKSDTLTVDSSGKWLSADCGTVKPMQPAK